MTAGGNMMTEYAEMAELLDARLADLLTRAEVIEDDLRHPLDADSSEQAVDLADDDCTYPFQPSNTFGEPSEEGDGQGVYSIENQVTTSAHPYLTFGLTQAATVNGKDTGPRPLNAQAVPSMMSIANLPLTTVYVWLQADCRSETVITRVTSPASRVVFGGSVNEHTLVFDASKGMFLLEDA